MLAYLEFVRSSDLSQYSGKNMFYIQSPIPTGYESIFSKQRGNVNITRTVNKNLMQSQLPVNSYYDGGLCVDIGMCDDTFSIDFETYSLNEYRYLCSLVKCNTGMKSAKFYIADDIFAVAIRNVSFSFTSGRGDHVKVNLSLTVINTRFAT